MRPTEIVVVVPARDEVDALPHCLRALLVAVARCSVPARVVVVDDASADDTARVATQSLSPPHHVVTGPGQDVGAARRCGVEAIEHGAIDPRSVWVASTDADTVVPPDWLRRQVVHAARGADAVAGVVRLRDAPRALSRAFEARYRRPAAGDHPHLHAANLGVRLSVLRAAGSWRPASHAEEHDLWGRLPGGTTVVADAALVVTTSARLRGRAPIGLAADLMRLVADEPAGWRDGGGATR